MKKFNITGLFLLLFLSLASCKEDTFTLTSELPQFETKEGMMLLEVIVPYGTGVNDNIYIYGDFNGGIDAVGNPQWLLQRANTTSGVPAKFGIYLDPTTFQDGKTLANGYTFYNIQNGAEVDSEGNGPVWHYDYPEVGKRLNVFVDYFEGTLSSPGDPDEVEHDGYAIFVVNETTWTSLALYAWGDAEAFGGWPGMEPTGKITISGVNYTYFDTGADNEGLNLNLIFNNNGGGIQLADYNVTLDQDYYLLINDDGVFPYDPNGNIEHDGAVIYVNDLSGWDELYLYMWGDVNDLNGPWPGMLPTGTQTINGVTYKYFDVGAANAGLTEHVILNNNAGTQFDDVVVFDLNDDVYIELTPTGATQIDPDNYTPSDPGDVEPAPDPEEPTDEFFLYIEDNTGWDSFYVYSYGGGGEIFGKWPGETSETTKTIGDKTFLVFSVPATEEAANLIFNDNAGTQYDAMSLTLDKDYYIIAGSTAAELWTAPTYHLYIDNQTGWNSFYVYAWGDSQTFGDWPGASSTTIETINGVDYLVFDLAGTGETENIIFNDYDGTQYDAFTITLDKDYYITASPTEAKIKE